MKTIPEKITDSIIRNTITLDRFAEGINVEITKVLIKAQNEIAGAIAEINPHAPLRTEWRTTRYQKLHKRISDILNTAYEKAKKETNSNLEGMINPLVKKTIKDFNEAIGVDIFDVTLTPEFLKSIVTKTMIDGKIIGDWWDKQQEDTKIRIQEKINLARQELEVGLVQGESITELISRVRKKEMSFKLDAPSIAKPDAMDISKNEADALVRTSMMQVAQNVRMEIYKQNQDILNGYEVIATLDKRTTPLCRALDKKRFDLNFRPIGHDVPYPPRGFPAHWRCRSTLIPITKSYQELMNNDSLPETKKNLLKDIPAGKRSSMGGEASASMDYNEWLKTQPEEIQQEVLGITRQKLWKENKLTMADMLHQNGRQLTLDELIKMLR